ncbi:MAG: hypothetical protein KME15_21180, partial [Drouetiella hepatica Uher 2000/2452]|nr:hypothetical protein [Drouetiella hepatica Uher 2000/2452]
AVFQRRGALFKSCFLVFVARGARHKTLVCDHTETRILHLYMARTVHRHGFQGREAPLKPGKGDSCKM